MPFSFPCVIICLLPIRIPCFTIYILDLKMDQNVFQLWLVTMTRCNMTTKWIWFLALSLGSLHLSQGSRPHVVLMVADDLVSLIFKSTDEFTWLTTPACVCFAPEPKWYLWFAIGTFTKRDGRRNALVCKPCTEKYKGEEIDVCIFHFT